MPLQTFSAHRLRWHTLHKGILLSQSAYCIKDFLYSIWLRTRERLFYGIRENERFREREKKKKSDKERFHNTSVSALVIPGQWGWVRERRMEECSREAMASCISQLQHQPLWMYFLMTTQPCLKSGHGMLCRSVQALAQGSKASMLPRAGPSLLTIPPVA